MGVTLLYKVLLPSNYNWGDMTATGPAIQINDYLESWVVDCNGNAGNTLKQLTIKKKPTDGTNTNNTLPNGTANNNYIERKGWVIEANRSATQGLIVYFAGASRATDSQDYYEFVVSEKNNWFDSGQTNGYGLFSNWVFGIWDNYTADFNYANRSSFAVQLIISYSSDPNQEFFCVSFLGSPTGSAYWFSWIIFKDNLDEWGALLVESDATVAGAILVAGQLRSIAELIRNTTTTDVRLTSVTLTTTSNLNTENGQNMPNPNRRIAHPQVLTVDNNQTRFTFGEELIVNSRQFYGLAPRLLVIEK